MIVMKFGGTSLEDAAAMENVCRIVKGRVRRRPILVLSAAAGITNALIRCAELAAEAKKNEATSILSEQIIERHYEIIQGLVNELREQDRLIRQFKIYHEELQNLLYGISITGDLSSRVLDFVMSYGERMISTIMAQALRERNVNAAYVDSRKCIITNSLFGKAEPLLDPTRQACENVLGDAVDKGLVPVMPGFVGANARNVTTTMGRGGSDFSAAIVGAVLDTKDIEIWTDVDGIMTADPKLVPAALRVKEMSFQEASELAYFGAKVLHPSTLLPAVDKNIPVHILNSRRPDAGGTLIKSSIASANIAVKSISYKRGITILNISSARMLGSYGFMKKIFDIFNEHQTSVDLVTTSEVSISLSIEHAPSLDSLITELEKYGKMVVSREKAVMCVVGEKLRSEKGLAARIFGRLKNIPIDMISHGSSDINITFVIDDEHVPEAVRELHDEFFSNITAKGIFE